MYSLSNKLAIGTAQFGMSYGISNKNGQAHQDDITDILDLAWANKINTLDTAKSYGTSEKAIGSYLQKHVENSWKIITKISDFNESITIQLLDSMKKLSVRPTSLLAHSADLFLNEKFQSELIEARDNQLIKKTGVSLYSEDEIHQILESTFKPDVIQLPMNILDTRLYRHGMLARLNEKGIEIHVRSAFLQGLFYLSASDLNKHFSDAVPYIEKLKSVAVKAELTLAELSLLWLVNLEEVSKVIIGIDNAGQLKAHLETLKNKVDLAIFDEILSVHYENENILNPSLWPLMS